MTSMQLFRGMTGIDPELLVQVEKMSAEPWRPQKRKTIRRTFLIAALIATMLMLVGCGIAYALRLRSLKIGEYRVPSQTIDQAAAETAPALALDVLSLQGIQNTPHYLAGQEWLTFSQNYTFQGGEYWESPPEYWAYSVRNQEMLDKLNEICNKYDLKIIGKSWHEHQDCSHFLKLAGVESLLLPDSQAEISAPQGRFFPGGSFTIYGSLTMGEARFDLTYHCVKKDVFYDVFGYADSDRITQRNYTTKQGVPVLLLEGEQSRMILADREDCFISLTLSGDAAADLEAIVDCLDLKIHSVPLDTAAADAREQASQETVMSMQNDPNRLRRATYAEYIEDLIQGEQMRRVPTYAPPETTYAFYDADGNGKDELLIFSDGSYIRCIVGMKNGKTDEGKYYRMTLCEGNVFIDWPAEGGLSGEYWYHIFRFANNGDPVFSNPKEESIVRLKKDADGAWWRTSSTDHYAAFDTKITEEEAQSILDAYTPVHLETYPISQFKERNSDCAAATETSLTGLG